MESVLLTSRRSVLQAGAGPLQTTEHVVRKGTKAKSCPEEAPPPCPLCPGSYSTPLRKASCTALSPPSPESIAHDGICPLGRFLSKSTAAARGEVPLGDRLCDPLEVSEEPA